MNEQDHSFGSTFLSGNQNVPLPDEEELPVILRAPGSFSHLNDDPSVESSAESLPIDVKNLDDNAIICACRGITKSSIVESINTGHASLPSIAHCCKAGGDCPDCHDQIAQLIVAYKPTSPKKPKLNKIEEMKLEKDGLDCLPDLWKHATSGNWEELTEDDKHRFKWYGVFFRKQTPGNFMMRIRMSCGFSNARQFRVLADMSDEFGKGFCDLTTRQQVQMRWFTIDQVPEIWRRLADVGLTSQQTGMDNIRGVCGCPLAGVTPHELFDASPVARELTQLILNNKEFTNLPRKFNITITGCLENCCHTETQDIALVPSYRELEGRQVNGFNVLVGGKQGSGGFTPAKNLDVFVQPDEAAGLCAHIVRIFRDHGFRESRTRSRLAFLIEDYGINWLRSELQRRWGRLLEQAGPDVRKKTHVDHLGIHPQRHHARDDGPPLNSVGLLVPVGRITTAQMRGVADIAERYGNGDIRLTVQQNLVVPYIPENKIGALTEEPIFKDLPFDPSPIMRGLVSCVGSDYCHMALIETKGWAIDVARELDRRTAGKKILPLTIHWSGCPAGCGLHQVSTIGLQGCRTRVDGEIVDAAHVCVNGKTGPDTRVAADLMYDVPCDQLADALEPLIRYLPRQ
ncbi:MAG TPA: (2Fe-2S)-binding protein [Gemmataceae bacterium]|nr:(2Fe-2S)-binding protein [Gemmataceae bacterium]